MSSIRTLFYQSPTSRIHYVLCNKLRQFPYEDIEFFLPQLCHLIISVDNESMALEEFLLDLCEESVTAALLTFWLFQTYLHDLSSNPQSTAFQTCRRVYNKVQHIVFGLNDVGRHEKIKENVLPVTVLSSFVLASVALPMIPKWAGPLAVAQARKPQPITDATTTDTAVHDKPSGLQAALPLNAKPKRKPDSRNASVTSVNLSSPQRAVAAKAIGQATTASPKPRACQAQHRSLYPRRPSTTRPETPPLTAGLAPRTNSDSILRRHSHHTKNAKNIGDLSSIQKTRLLRQHYFRSQTQFLQALEGISNRLVIVPKQARMSALRAELALIARDLPAEIDVPVICPPTLADGAPGKSRHHRIVRLNPTEATVLNSAEKVPYLLMVEVLREDFTFDPDTPDNQRLLPELFGTRGNSKRLFDLSSELPKSATATPPPEPAVDSVFEPTSGDLSSSNLIKSLDEEGQPRASTPKQSQLYGAQRLSSGATTLAPQDDVANDPQCVH
ncbi:hypothetical protein NLG97_g11047 [Lecanicillium saksenae]|uniref:Uncharacterized protein n=1 Tax=Lecanicillium saksenae TaxID=468837 RepID=A0ACC1QEG0_9HYPO|nr:hypothetical protein NLG97_g11047 [Lecanicillium saksenae]